MNTPENQAKKEKIAMILFGIGAVIILGIFFITTIPNIRNISVPINDVIKDVENPVEFRSQIENIPDQLNQEIQELERQEQLDTTFDGLEQRTDSTEESAGEDVQIIE